jgi:transcriptional regulator with XRE-family HTH domain
MENQLKDILKNARMMLGLTLRDAAKKSGISSPYVSQIESGKIPAPRILDKLAKAYGISYEKLMIAAGHLKPGTRGNPDASDIALSATKDLNEDEKLEVIEFIKFLRSKRKE